LAFWVTTHCNFGVGLPSSRSNLLVSPHEQNILPLTRKLGGEMEVETAILKTKIRILISHFAITLFKS